MNTSLPTSLPSPRKLDPSSIPSLRWGILGPGWIARVFVEAVLKHTKQRVCAVASRNAERARSFAADFAIPQAYGSYEELFADPEVDVIYVATRQHVHREQVLAAIAAGKHVLVEKPFTTTVADAHAIREAARAAGVFVMEAHWTTYLPQSDVIRQVVAEGILGDIYFAQADMGHNERHTGRLFERDGGGVSHDFGVYPLGFVSQFFPGQPAQIEATGRVTELGIDSELEIRLAYPGENTARVTMTMLSYTPCNAWATGSLASLEVTPVFYTPSSINLRRAEFTAEIVSSWSDTSGVIGHEGLSYQADYLAHYVSQGLTESPLRNLDDSVRAIEILTTARHQIGAYYPGEAR